MKTFRHSLIWEGTARTPLDARGNSKTLLWLTIPNACSNAIRFSISDLSRPTARIMPTVYQDRSDISLFDAQYLDGKKRPIPHDIIENVVLALLGFKRTCEDFGVPNYQIRVVATEATRQAVNSQEYRDRIKSATGWTVELLRKEEEGRIGAMGIASSFASIKGLALDLGGGSIQMTWIISQDGEVKMSPRGSVSFPWGAAALMRLLGDPVTPSAQEQLQREIALNFRQAINDLELPPNMVEDASKNGLSLYLSGGGFRGWGHILMSMHAISPYPIPIINGFRVPSSEFSPQPTAELSIDDTTFRISARRSSQVPAVKLIILALVESVPSISNIFFAQGGVREGLIFSALQSSVRAEHPLVVASQSYAPPSASILLDLLQSLIPSPAPTSPLDETSLFSSEFLTSIINLAFTHSPLSKDIRSSAALRSTTSGLLANTHGISHHERALLGLILCERWGGELSPSDTKFYSTLLELVGAESGWWAKYIGRAIQGLGKLFPAGLVRDNDKHAGGGGNNSVKLSAQWGISSKKTSSDGSERAIVVDIAEQREGISGIIVEWRDLLEKVGKKKNWVVVGGKGKGKGPGVGEGEGEGKGVGAGKGEGKGGWGGKEGKKGEDDAKEGEMESIFGLRVEVRIKRWS